MKQTKSKAERVRDVIAECNDRYRSIGLDVFTATERIEELWFEIEDLLEGMDSAEQCRDSEHINESLYAIYNKLDRIQHYLPDEFL